MITQEQLSEMSKFDINLLIARIQKRKYTVTNLNSDELYLVCDDSDEEINYCENPNDIMPIATEHKIGSRWSHGHDKWGSECLYDEDEYCIYVFNENRLRAICEVYILMNQGGE